MKKNITLLLLFICCLTTRAQIDSLKVTYYKEKFHQHRVKSADSADYYVAKLDSITRPYEISRYRVSYFNIVAAWANEKGKSEEILHATKRALEISQKLGDKRATIVPRFNFASRLTQNGNIKEAILQYKQLEDVLGSSKNDKTIRSAIYFNMISAYITLKDVGKAIHYHGLMSKYIQSYEDSISSYHSKILILNEQQKYRETVKVGLKALVMVRKNDLRNQMRFKSYTGSALARVKETHKAKKYLLEAVSLSNQLGFADSSIELGLGEVAYSEERYQEALQHFFKARDVAKNRNEAQVLTRILDKIRTTHYIMGNYKKAFDTQKEDITLRDSMLSEEKQKYVADLEAKYELKDKDRTIALKVNENLLQQKLLLSETRKKKTFTYLFLLASLFLILLVWGILRMIRSRNTIAAQKEKIDEYAQRLETANTHKDKLFAMLGHDLRSPVSSLVATLEVARAKGSDTFLKIQHSLNNIQLILNNLLSWSDMQLKEARPYLIHTDPEQQIRSVLNQVQLQARDKDISLVTEYRHTRPVHIDENYLQIALRNVLTNAVKFTPREGVIYVTTADEPDAVKVSVRDSGIGMTPDQLDAIFAYPVSAHGTDGEKGTGLGLTLSRELLHQVNGEISARSKPGVGTEITILLPLQPEVYP